MAKKGSSTKVVGGGGRKGTKIVTGSSSAVKLGLSKTPPHKNR